MAIQEQLIEFLRLKNRLIIEDDRLWDAALSGAHVRMYSYDPATGSITRSVSGGFIPYGSGDSITNSPSIDADRAYLAMTASDKAYAVGDLPEAARQLDIFYLYCGCSSGPPYTGISFPPQQLPPGSLPPITVPPIQQ